MKHYKLSTIVAAGSLVLALLAGCHHSRQQSNLNIDKQDTLQHISVSEQPAMQETSAEWRQPDVKVHVRQGQPLAMQTEGLMLTAVDAAVQHEADYSVTLLNDGELPLLPQGMVNMTAAAAGYRLLPGGEHFQPYAELRMTYDPSRLPEGYSADDIYTSYYDTTTLAWVRLERIEVDTLNHEIVSATTHFTDFINELLKAPEMPETQAFVPTQISGLEAANPLAGYTTMAPPEANSMGTANLSYPFQVPAGRAGMQPNLALNYNSNGGNGVCGMGWEFSVPCISVETRWGVPLYHATKETETYLFNGEQLLVEHGAMPTFSQAPVARETNKYTKRFYPRVEGAFDSILRHGTSPQTYWWEVYDRSGTRYVYGLGDGELKSQNKNAIAKWYLTRIIDRNGNVIRYHYKTDINIGEGENSGTAVYLEKITYTSPNDGFTEQPWYGYCITFYYGNRSDRVVSGNYGVKENICRRLDSVRTWYVKNEPSPARDCDSLLRQNNLPGEALDLQNCMKEILQAHDERDLDAIATWLLNADTVHQSNWSPIRGYRLLYSYSRTGKSLLDAVVEMSPDEWEHFAHTVSRNNLDNGNTKLKYHRFEYRGFDRPSFGEEHLLQTTVYEAPSGMSEFYPSPLGGSREWKGGINFSAGLGLDLAAWLRTINIEVNGSISPKSTSHGTTTLIDINGDGYPDLLYKKANGVWNCQLYIPDLATPAGTGRFGNPVVAHMPTDEFSSTITKNNFSVGLGLHAGVEYYEASAGLNIGAQYNHSNSDNTTYFADVNADGLPDIVKNGRVWYNNSHDNIVSFDPQYQVYVEEGVVCEPNYYSLEGAEAMDGSIFEEGHISETHISYFSEKGRDGLVSEVTSDTLVIETSDTIYRSAVRVWIAQYSGDINISGVAQLDPNFIEAISRTNADGVHVSIQHNNDSISGTGHDLNLNHPSCTFSENLYVDEGDRIYFRVEALENDLYDVVNWNPVIYYTYEDTTQLDEALRKRYVFSAKEDFLAWQTERFYMPMDGTVHIDANYSVPRPMTDDVHLRIRCMDNAESYTKWISDTVVIPQGDTITNGSLSFNKAMDSSDVLIFQAYSNNDVNWTILQWHPHVVSESFIDPDIPVYSVMYDENGQKDTVYTIDIYPSPSYKYSDGVYIPDSLSEMFRSLYRGWGSFTYNSDTLRTTMDESLIRPDVKYNQYENMTDPDQLDDDIVSLFGDTTQAVSAESIQSGMSAFVPNSESTGTAMMNATFDTQNSSRIWTANGYRSFVNSTQIGLFNWQNVQATLTDSILLYPVTNRSIAASGSTAVGPVKGSAQNGFSVHVSLSAGVQDAAESDEFPGLGISACANYSHGVSRLTAEFIDMNGDGYPDIVGENDVQYTNSRGGLSDVHGGTVLTDERGIMRTVYDAFSLQGGSSYASYEKRGKAKGEVHIEQRCKGVGFSGSRNLAQSFDRLSLAWMDMNGDGLPDCVSGDDVYLNLGYDYYGRASLNSNPLPKNTSISRAKSHGLDFSDATSLVNTLTNTSVSGINKSFSAGKSISESENDGTVLYSDINGDGLVDKIVNNSKVFFNTGWGFSTNAYTLNCAAKSKGIGRNVDYNGNFTIGVPFSILFLNLKFQGSAGVNIGNSISTTEAVLMDMNIDGLPDIVRRNGSKVLVRYNQMYDVDKLVSVRSFYGNQMDLEYAQASYSSRSRQRPTVMASLIVSDKTATSNDIRHFTFEYSDYVHSNAERTPYGFEYVVVKQYVGGQLYRVTRQHYRTDLYKMRGRKTSELVTDANGKPYVENVWNYELKQISDGAVVPLGMASCFGPTWPALDSTLVRHYDPATQTVKIEAAERYIHQDSGRVAEYINRGDRTVSGDDIHSKVEYTRGGRNQSALPKEMTVFDAQYHQFRRRAAKYNERGLLSKLVIYNDGNDTSSVSNYTYDEYGNPLSVELPPNDSNQRPKFLYSYDTLMHQFRTSTTDGAFNLQSRAEYDVRLGVPLRIYSVSGDSISYTYDDWGRPLSIRAPQECDSNDYPTIQYVYWDDAHPARQVNLPGFHSFTMFPAVIGMITEPECRYYNGGPIWAQTLHRSKLDPDLEVSTVLFADGHGRVLQTRRTAVIDGQDNQVASGHVIYDDAGRPVKVYEPFLTPGMPLCKYIEPEDIGLYTWTGYDLLDRTVWKEIPSENIVTTYDYGFASVGGVTCFQTKTTDPEYNTTTTLTDARGLTLQCIDALQGVTQFEYDAMGQMKHSFDPEGFRTSYGYDMLGHVLDRTHPDAGITKYQYDAAGNLTKEINPLGEISFDYTYYKLAHKRYSNMPGNDVTYTYGNSGTAAGLPVRIADGSGVQTLEYDEMGRVSKSVRVLSVPTTGYAYAFTHTFKYDSWNRMWSMTYPDGERVDYRYNRAGDLVLMKGDKNGDTRRYIDDILYNKYGQRTQIAYGNGSHTEYSYDPLQRLQHLLSKDNYGQEMQNIDYTFDKVGNIKSLVNSAPDISGLGGDYANYYSYDPLNRLVAANGGGNIEWQSRDFDLEEMQYSPSGRLGVKRQWWQSVTTQGVQHMEYGYSGTNDKPHAPRSIVNHATGALYDLQWDGAGNLVRLSVQNDPEAAYATRFLHWTEDNRLYAVSDERYYSYYAYDHTGERTLKMTGAAADVDQNAWNQHIYSSLNHVTLYPSAYLVLSDHGYTKHYYAGAERVAARIGSGGLSHDTTCVSQNHEVVSLADELFWHSYKLVNNFELKDIDKKERVRINGKVLEEASRFDYDKVPVHRFAELKAEAWKIMDIIEHYSQPSTPSTPSYPAEEPEVYFYHSDHLGGANWITNEDGKPVQHLQYLPYGEPFVNQHPAGYQERFTFTGKERDAETGYSYFSARYMDHEILTLFLSVDRYADKYPFISPYAYCAWNPIRLTDPSGDTIIFKDDIVEKMFDDVYNEVSCRMIKLEKKGLKKNSRREEYEALSKIKQSMDDVRNSKTKFYYSSLPNPDGSIKSGGHTYGKEGVDGIIVEITAGCFGTLVHETKHASQYSSGDWELDMGSIDEFGHFGLINYDLQDEFDAYRQENDYQFYLNHETYFDDNRIEKDVKDWYKDTPYIIQEFIQYNASNPYNKK